MLEFAPMLFELAVDDEFTMFDELSLLLESFFEGAFNSLLLETLLELDSLLDELLILELFLLLEILLELDSLLEAFFDEALLDDLTIELFLLELFTELLIKLDFLLNELFTLELFLLLLEILLELDFLLDELFTLELLLLLETLLDELLTLELFSLLLEILLELDFLLDELFTLELFLLLLEEILLELDFFDDELLDELAANGVSITHALSVTSFPSTVTVVFPLSSIVTLIFSLLMLYPAGALVSFTVYVPAGNPLKPTTPAAFETAVRFFPFPVSSNVAPDKPAI